MSNIKLIYTIFYNIFMINNNLKGYILNLEGLLNLKVCRYFLRGSITIFVYKNYKKYI